MLCVIFCRLGKFWRGVRKGYSAGESSFQL
jgi:hypothetical protein